MENRKHLTQKQRIKLMLFQNGYCPVCNNKLKPGNIEYDHIQALVHGGDNDPDNWRAICAVPCHRDKTRRDAQAGAKVKRLAFGKPRKGQPLPGSRASRWKRKMDGTVVER